MFFEGSEKKVEVYINNDGFSLLEDVSDCFWASMIECCQAKIVSSIHNEECKAFVLSESSLFVWRNKFLLLTCGTTQLVKSIEYFIHEFGIDKIEHFLYQRRNEYFAQAQPTCFGDDIKQLAKHVSGKAYRFGELDAHHNYLFHVNRDLSSQNHCKTYELLAYQICDDASNKLMQTGLSNTEIRDYLQLEKWLPDYQYDDFVFTPYGYSVNAIKGEHYFTVHITPQTSSSYVSIESNINLPDLFKALLIQLKPASFDLLTVNEALFEDSFAHIVPKHYICSSHVEESLSNSFLVNFANYIQPQNKSSRAIELDISAENHTF